jgi:thiol-disulfide isomerase/thioredoxin
LDFEILRKFIIYSTFIGPAPGISRELSTENGLKIFQYNLPVLILFRNTSVDDSRYYQEQLFIAEKEISDDIMVCIADVNNEMTKKLAMLTGVEDFT